MTDTPVPADPKLPGEKRLLSVYAPDTNLNPDAVATEWNYLFNFGGYDNVILALMFIGLFKAIDQNNEWPEGTTFRTIVRVWYNNPESELTELTPPN